MPTLSEHELEIHLPSARVDGLDQDEEYCEIEEDGARRRIRFHDYDEIYAVPGLYERLFAEILSCKSPEVVVEFLGETLREQDADPEDLRVVDLGAGNGMVAEELDRIGAESIVGIDAIEEAKQAAERDRPGLYDAYHALDITDPPADEQRELEEHDFNCLTCVAALGFGDLPPDAFQAAYDLVDPEGWVAFNIREKFIDDGDSSGFARLLDRMVEDGELVEHGRKRYPHRLSVSGEPIHYVAVVVQKNAPA